MCIRDRVDMNEKHLLKLSTALQKTLSENNDALLKESEDQLREMKQKSSKIKSACNLKEKQNYETVSYTHLDVYKRQVMEC